MILLNQVILEKLMIVVDLMIFREYGDFDHLGDSGEFYNLVIFRDAGDFDYLADSDESVGSSESCDLGESVGSAESGDSNRPGDFDEHSLF